MNASAPTPTMTAALADCLPTVHPGEARLARIAFDRRFARWAGRACGEPGGRVVTGGAPHDAIALDFSCMHGNLQVSVPLASWPALGMVARMADPALAREVAEAMLTAPLSALADDLPGLTLKGLAVHTAVHSAPLEWVCGSTRIGLRALDAKVGARVRACLARAGSDDGTPLPGLRLPGRVHVGSRHLAPTDLATLAPGDAVLCGWLADGRRSPCHLYFGLGNTMQILAELDIDTSELTLRDAPRTHAATTSEANALGGAPAVAPQRRASAQGVQPAADVGLISVPISFEIDTARIRLNDLAALDAGAVIPLAAAARDAMVRIVCHEQIVGTGHLVVIGNRLGVRIAHMATGGIAAPAAP